MRGFTLIETLIVLFLFTTIIGMPMMFLWGIGRSDQLTATTREVVAALNEAQTNTINGKSVDGQQPATYGVYFQSGYYVLFAGSTYNAGNSYNQRNDLPSGLTFSQIQVPNDQIVFSRVTGQVTAYNPSLNFVVLQEGNTGTTEQINISKMGTVTYQ